jgi:hypothetical protein
MITAAASVEEYWRKEREQELRILPFRLRPKSPQPPRQLHLKLKDDEHPQGVKFARDQLASQDPHQAGE